MGKVKDEADAQRNEAKKMLNAAFGMPKDISSGSIDRSVDCIISAAMLEVVMVISQGLGKREAL